MKTYSTVTEYISSANKAVQPILKKIRSTIKKATPKATEKISYAMPTYHLNENLVHFALMKNHIGFYPTPSAIEKFKNELTDYSTSKGCIRFKIDDKQIPYSLITKIVKFRLKETTKR